MNKDGRAKSKEWIWKLICGAIVPIACVIITHLLTDASTQATFVERLSVYFDVVDENMSYEQAIDAMRKESGRLKNENTLLEKQITDLQSKVDSLDSEIDNTEMIARAELYASSGNYEVAIPILTSVGKKSDVIDALLKDYTTNYEISVIENAEALANEGNYDEAIALLDKALKVIPNNSVLLDKKGNITPKYLVDTIECYKAENLWLLDRKECIKMAGKGYRHAIYSEQSDIAGSMFNNAYSANAFYNLDGQYSQLSGIAGNIDFSGSGTIGKQDGGQVYDAEITIWGDDQEIGTINLLSDDATKEFNIPVSGVKILEFQIKCSGNSKVGIAEIQIR